MTTKISKLTFKGDQIPHIKQVIEDHLQICEISYKQNVAILAQYKQMVADRKNQHPVSEGDIPYTDEEKNTIDKLTNDAEHLDIQISRDMDLLKTIEEVGF